MKAFQSIVIFFGILLGLTSLVVCGDITMSIRPPQFEPPAKGTTVDKSFKITLDGIPSGNCVSVVQGEATILVSRQLLEHLRAAKPGKWKTEDELMALIRGGRAEELLQSVTKSTDEFKCTAVQTPVPIDSLYLISELLDAGQAEVIENKTNQRVRHIFVHFRGMRAGPLAGIGHISYLFTLESAPFLVLEWWVS
jgi:hypothetical protein